MPIIQVLSLVAAIILLLLVFFTGLYLIIQYSHPQDQGLGASWLPKIILILGIEVSCSQVLLLPLDVAWQGINIWQAFYWIYLGIWIIVVPITLFVYEGDEDKNLILRLLISIFQCILLVIILSIIFCILYFTASTVQIDFQIIQSQLQSNSNQIINISNYNIQIKQSYFLFQPQPLLCLMAIIIFIGYFQLALCGGLGLSSLPLSFKTTQDAKQKKQKLKNKINDLLRSAMHIGRVDGGQEELQKIKYNNKRQSYSQPFNQLNIKGQQNPLLFYGKNVSGVFMFITTLLLIISCLVTGIIGHDFLGFILVYLQKQTANIFSFVIAGYMGIYLLFCIIKGYTDIGLILPNFLRSYPLKRNGTWMNSFLMALWCALTVSPAVSNLLIIIYGQWARWSSLNLFLKVTQRMIFTRWFFQNKIGFYLLISCFGLFLIIVVYKKCEWSNEQKKIGQLVQKIKSNQNIELQQMLLRHDKKYFRK